MSLTVNYPWGSLLKAVALPDAALLGNLPRHLPQRSRLAAERHEDALLLDELQDVDDHAFLPRTVM